MTGVVDLLDVALRARGAVDVSRIDHPVLEPVETFPAHSFRQHRNRAASQQPGDRHAASTVVAGRGPDRAVTRDVEGSGQQAGNEASIRGQHLVGADHRESVAQCHDDPRPHAGERVGQHDVLGDFDQRPAVRAVVPVHAKEIAGVGTVGIDPGDLFGLRRQVRRRIGEFGDAGQFHAERPQMRHVSLVAVPIDDPALESWCHVRSMPVVAVQVRRESHRRNSSRLSCSLGAHWPGTAVLVPVIPTLERKRRVLIQGIQPFFPTTMLQCLLPRAVAFTCIGKSVSLDVDTTSERLRHPPESPAQGRRRATSATCTNRSSCAPATPSTAGRSAETIPATTRTGRTKDGLVNVLRRP